MNYLFGDSTPSQLTSNVLEFLRDALDFSVFVLESNARVERGKQHIVTLEEESDLQIERLAKFIGVVTRAIADAEHGSADSPAALCAERLTGLVGASEREFIKTIRGKLANDVAQVGAEEAAERAACVKALEGLLAHEPPDSHIVTRSVLSGSGRYEATLDGRAEFGLAWSFELGIPETSLWASPVHLDRILPGLEIHAPQLAGWISKELKIKPLKIDRYVVTELVLDGGATRFKLRPEAGLEAGFDVDVESKRVSIERVGPSGDESTGSFEVHADDVKPLLEIAEKLRTSAAELTRVKLVSTTVGDAPFQAQPSFVPFVEKVITILAPVVREISERSLKPTELVLRRLLGNDRREEIFVEKATLREKYARLADPLRELFYPLGLELESPSKAPPPVAPPPAVRAELPRSVPPPPPEPPPLPPESSPAFIARTDGQPRNEALVDALKKIRSLGRSGRMDDSYREYALLFESTAFADYRPEDQRQAMKLMILTKTPPPKSDAVADAHRAAVKRLESLVAVVGEPADYEMLGVARLLLDETAAAKAAFSKALEIETSRNPTSDLVASLKERLRPL